MAEPAVTRLHALPTRGSHALWVKPVIFAQFHAVFSLRHHSTREAGTDPPAKVFVFPMRTTECEPGHVLC
ncbi:protein of unknown function [Nitrospira japonica]|uniref:Uncharacterized protein n=1 Tax=Nitrospira japonica TaxID=1325564 RepID=A0A1W1I5U3_9BACT|nr:protein of unknown function [Nitrospira japonica]